MHFKHHPFAVAFSILCLSISSSNANKPPAVFDIPMLKGIAIDGDSSDWQDNGFRADFLTIDGITPISEKDFNPRFRLAWCDSGLLLLAVVLDDSISESSWPGDVWKSDGVEFFLGRKWGENNYCQVQLTPGIANRPMKPKQAVYDRRLAVTKGQPVRAEASCRKIAGGYCIEAFIPWSNLTSTARLGDTLAFQIYINDSDEGHHCRALWFPRDGAHVDPKLMFAIRLSQKPSAPYDQGTLLIDEYIKNKAMLVQIDAPGTMANDTVRILLNGKMAAAIPAPAKAFRVRGSFYLPAAYTSNQVAVHYDKIDFKQWSNRHEDDSITLQFHLSIDSARDHQFRAWCDLFPMAETAKPIKVIYRTSKVSSPSSTSSITEKIGDTVDLKFGKGLYRIFVSTIGFPGRELSASGIYVSDSEMIIKELIQYKTFADAYIHESWAGMLLYLIERVENSMKSEGYSSMSVSQDFVRLADFALSAKKGFNFIPSLHGIQEWAFVSRIDSTGQPFTIDIPEKYDPSKRYPLTIFMHGVGALHGGVQAQFRGAGFVLSVLGRARSTYFEQLGEVDVMEAIDFVKQHWSIDSTRIYLTGTSMGGGGAYRIGSRHPEFFASLSPGMGDNIFAISGNLLNLPLYAVHGSDDFTCPVGWTRGPVNYVNALVLQRKLFNSSEFHQSPFTM
jgi:hypothetical protein